MDYNYVQVQVHDSSGEGDHDGWYVYTEESPEEAKELLKDWEDGSPLFDADAARIVEMDSDNWI
jgi:hypothetical protein